MQPLIVLLSTFDVNLSQVLAVQRLDGDSNVILDPEKIGETVMLQVQMAFGWHVIVKGDNIPVFLNAWEHFTWDGKSRKEIEYEASIKPSSIVKKRATQA